MKTDSIWSVVYLLGPALAFLIRRMTTCPDPQANASITPTLETRSDSYRVILGQICWALSQAAVVVRMTTTWLAFADYPPTLALRSLGLMLLASSLLLLGRSHWDLGSYWDRRVAIHSGHKLVTHGVYRWIRHPLYAAHLLMSFAIGLLVPNVLVGVMAVVGMTLVYLGRVSSEEQMLSERFGDNYLAYAARTSRLLPRSKIREYFKR